MSETEVSESDMSETRVRGEGEQVGEGRVEAKRRIMSEILDGS